MTSHTRILASSKITRQEDFRSGAVLRRKDPNCRYPAKASRMVRLFPTLQKSPAEALITGPPPG